MKQDLATTTANQAAQFLRKITERDPKMGKTILESIKQCAEHDAAGFTVPDYGNLHTRLDNLLKEDKQFSEILPDLFNQLSSVVPVSEVTLLCEYERKCIVRVFNAINGAKKLLEAQNMVETDWAASILDLAYDSAYDIEEKWRELDRQRDQYSGS